MVGNNTPVFFVRDPSKFQDFIHSQKRLPDTGLRSNDMQWDFWTLSPESAHQVTILMSDRGIPAHLAPHARLLQPHLLVDQRRRRALLGQVPRQDRPGHREPDRATRPPRWPARTATTTAATCTTRSPTGDAPEWTFYVQVMPFADAADYRFNPFDLTKVWPKGDYPLIEVGRMALDRNPENFFAEVEQASFNPSNLVPGTGLSPDRMLMARIFSYHDTHLHRIGPNYEQLPINRPQCPVHSYNKDGHDDLPPRGRPAGLRAELLRRPGGRPDGRAARDRLGRRGRRAGARPPTRSTARTTTSASRARSCAR